MSVRALPEDIAQAALSIDGIAGIEVHAGPVFDERDKRWRFEIALAPPGVTRSNGIAAKTEWVVLLDDSYPYGQIDILPSREGGITATYPHQLANLLTSANGHRDGKICVSAHDSGLGRLSSRPESYEPTHRLRWHLQAALSWIEAASNNDLVRKGEPWEMPDFDVPLASDVVVHLESGDTLRRWQACKVQSGFVDIARQGTRALGSEAQRAKPGRAPRFVGEFRDRQGAAVLQAQWGSWAKRQQNVPRGIWVRLQKPPILEPWQPPRTWGELRRVCQEQKINLDEMLEPLLDELRYRPRSQIKKRFRNKKQIPSSVMLVGFPIPQKFGGPDVFLHWQALRLPTPTPADSQATPGFRPRRSNLWWNDRRGNFEDSKPISWLKSENWHIEQVSVRGSLDAGARAKSLAIVGVGALGSALANLLARMGLWHLVLIDKDTVEGGNLSRHVLTSADVQELKADAVGRRLEMTNPGVDVMVLAKDIADLSDEDWAAVEACDEILDTTGSDDVLRVLAVHRWQERKLLISVSLAADAERLFVYASQISPQLASDFAAWYQPHGESEHKRLGQIVNMGVGCWHPVSPARLDRILALTGMLLPKIEDWLTKPPGKADAFVVERPMIK